MIPQKLTAKLELLSNMINDVILRSTLTGEVEFVDLSLNIMGWFITH